jgi:DNA-binding FadR family transcriptional regulator
MAGDLQPYEDLHLVRKRLHVQIADKIQELIAAQRLRPGNKLPPERELAEGDPCRQNEQ